MLRLRFRAAGPSLVFDAHHDAALLALLAERGPGASVRAMDGAGAMALVDMGRAYAQRLEDSGALRGLGLEAHAR